ncbi:Rho/RAC guanine nucleotide exchange factor, putative [Entamoeba invadens IP1]|uniref:Rho/RAC guanine nucleotide exchange factor, putative n=1 Tax=Entamoeba invadens IP1 TaxID=370355 RepID=UPI0002C3D15E|nr:Rho/RAC guanine nucleotide exchange factor, putative [Entamoeba invadens IP1]ELP85093.1 Rho/RAC guanine nucleotide exchange factor, putative [Entamoeba invadens IP1]|eukprot:XP_004184439.1 Rho/RAC guanine nucleotide exchange factor, putative [Entamoeba invadens IP1]
MEVVCQYRLEAMDDNETKISVALVKAMACLNEDATKRVLDWFWKEENQQIVEGLVYKVRLPLFTQYLYVQNNTLRSLAAETILQIIKHMIIVDDKKFLMRLMNTDEIFLTQFSLLLEDDSLSDLHGDVVEIISRCIPLSINNNSFSPVIKPLVNLLTTTNTNTKLTLSTLQALFQATNTKYEIQFVKFDGINRLVYLAEHSENNEVRFYSLELIKILLKNPQENARLAFNKRMFETRLLSVLIDIIDSKDEKLLKQALDMIDTFSTIPGNIDEMFKSDIFHYLLEFLVFPFEVGVDKFSVEAILHTLLQVSISKSVVMKLADVGLPLKLISIMEAHSFFTERSIEYASDMISNICRIAESRQQFVQYELTNALKEVVEDPSVSDFTKDMVTQLKRQFDNMKMKEDLMMSMQKVCKTNTIEKQQMDNMKSLFSLFDNNKEDKEPQSIESEPVDMNEVYKEVVKIPTNTKADFVIGRKTRPKSLLPEGIYPYTTDPQKGPSSKFKEDSKTLPQQKRPSMRLSSFNRRSNAAALMIQEQKTRDEENSSIKGMSSDNESIKVETKDANFTSRQHHTQVNGANKKDFLSHQRGDKGRVKLIEAKKMGAEVMNVPTLNSVVENKDTINISMDNAKLLADLNLKKVTRRHVVQEMYTTEKTYTQNLLQCVNEIEPEMKKVMTEVDFNSLFNNISDVCNVHTKFFKVIEERWNQQKDVPLIVVSDIFLELFSNANLYDTYMYYYTHADSGLGFNYALCSPNVNKLAQEFKQRRLPIDQFLIQPIQRLPRYVLLLKELIKATPELVVDERERLSKALELCNKITLDFNGETKKIRSKKQLQEYCEKIENYPPNPSRVFIRNGNIITKSKKKKSVCHVVLMSDIVFFLLKKKQKYTIQWMVEFKDVTLIELKSSKKAEEEKNLVIEYGTGKEKNSVSMVMGVDIDSEAWLTDLNNCKKP